MNPERSVERVNGNDVVDVANEVDRRRGRRLPVVLALRRFVPPLDRSAAPLFGGWFGPIGVAVRYATLAVDLTEAEVVWIVGSLVAVGSILARGVTAVPAQHRYGRLDDDESW